MGNFPVSTHKYSRSPLSSWGMKVRIWEAQKLMGALWFTCFRVTVGPAMKGITDWVASNIYFWPFWRRNIWDEGCECDRVLTRGPCGLQAASFAPCPHSAEVSWLASSKGTVHGGSTLMAWWPPQGPTWKSYHIGSEASTYKYRGGGGGVGKHLVHNSHQNLIRIDLNSAWLSFFLQEEPSFFQYEFSPCSPDAVGNRKC